MKIFQKVRRRSKDGRERGLRFHQRIPAEGLVRIRSSRKDYSGFLVNISREGLMSKSRDLPGPDEEVDVSFRLLPDKHVYRMKAVVIWTASVTRPAWFRRMGVRFVDRGPGDEKRLAKYVSRSQAVP